LAEILVQESLSEFLISESDPSAGHYDAAFWSLTILGAALAAVLYASAPLVAKSYGQHSVQGLMQALSVTVILVAPSAVPVAILRRNLKFPYLSARIVAGVVAGGVVGIWMALNGYGVWSLVGQRVSYILTNAVFAWIAVPWRPGFASSRQEFRDVLAFGSTVLGLRGADIARVQIPTIIIGATLGPQTLGLFWIAWRLVEIASFLIMSPLRMVSQPAFARLVHQGVNPAGLLLDISRLSGLISFPAFFGLSIFAEPVLGVMFGSKWLGAAPILSVIAFVGVILCIEMVNQSFCLAAGRVRAITIVAWFEVGLAAGLIWVFSRQGIAAMSIAFVASFYVLWIVRIWIVSSIAEVPLRLLLGIHVMPLLGAGMMAAVVQWATAPFASYSGVGLLAGGVLLGIVFFGAYSALFMRDRLMLLRSFIVQADPK
ncbi:MAG: oligosaccharide flippase family protein, partial [Lysobacterales bacterium]